MASANRRFKDAIYEQFARLGKAISAPKRLELLDLLSDLNAERGTTVVMVLHELNHAARYADHMVVMAGGRVAAQGTPAEVLTADSVLAAFGREAEVIADPVTGGPLVVPRGRTRRRTEATLS